MSVNPIPDGYTAVTPYLIVDGATDAIAFYAQAFGATEVMRLDAPGTDMIVHAEIDLDGARIMLADANPDWHVRSPKSIGGTPVSLMIYCKDADAVFARAVAAGATTVMSMNDTFWGARFGQVQDPFGHLWSIATQVSEPTQEEIETGLAAMMNGECNPET